MFLHQYQVLTVTYFCECYQIQEIYVCKKMTKIWSFSWKSLKVRSGAYSIQCRKPLLAMLMNARIWIASCCGWTASSRVTPWIGGDICITVWIRDSQCWEKLRKNSLGTLGIHIVTGLRYFPFGKKKKPHFTLAWWVLFFSVIFVIFQGNPIGKRSIHNLVHSLFSPKASIVFNIHISKMCIT